MTTWFTSDHHFGHANIIVHCRRPFITVGDMEHAMIQRWNERVKPNDDVYHLGDLFSFKPREMDAEHALSIRRRLNGFIILLMGNHDVQPWLVDVMHDNGRLCPIESYDERKIDGRHVVLCHYPIESWNGMHHGSIHLHGHSHGMLKREVANRIDVGVDVWDFHPVRLEDMLHEQSR